MSSGQIVFLGAVAGLTIFLGLPVGRMQSISLGTKSFLSAMATGILLFLLWDVLTAAVEPVEGALTDGQRRRASLWLAVLLTGGFAVGSAEPRAVRQLAQAPPQPGDARPRRRVDRRVPGRAARRHDVSVELACGLHRDRHRSPQLLGGAGDRAVRGVGTSSASRSLWWSASASTTRPRASASSLP